MGLEPEMFPRKYGEIVHASFLWAQQNANMVANGEINSVLGSSGQHAHLAFLWPCDWNK